MDNNVSLKVAAARTTHESWEILKMEFNLRGSDSSQPTESWIAENST